MVRGTRGVWRGGGGGEEVVTGGRGGGQGGVHPTAPSMQVHWCLHPAEKLSPLWYILPLYSQDLPSSLATGGGGGEKRGEEYRRK